MGNRKRDTKFMRRLARALAENPSGARGEHLPHDVNGAENPTPEADRLTPTPAHSQAQGYMDSVKGTGNPVYSNFDRPSGRGIAAGHPDLRQSRPDFSGPKVGGGPTPVTFIGQAGFHSAFSGSDSPPGGDGGRPRVQLYDAASDAGRYSGMMPVGHFDNGGDHLTGNYSSAPNGESNGSHSLENPVSRGYHDPGQFNAPVIAPRPANGFESGALKASDRLAIMKNNMRRMG